MFSNINELMAILQSAKKVAPIIATKDVSIDGVVLPKDITKVFEDSKSELQTKVPYNVEKSYDCKWLLEQVVNKIIESQKTNKNTITLENRCCNKEDCPEILFMTIVISKLK